ncbi:MAG TPA: DUF4129 domain-containing protein [Planctomycetota bacterium]|nr:DUF4129 domain-containing protein [Planctomycetota bacterium]
MTTAVLSVAAGALLLLAQAGGQEGTRSGKELRKTLSDILASGEYETATPLTHPGASIWERIGRWIRGLFGSVGHLGSAAPVVVWGILISCGLVLLAIFIHGGVVLARALRASRSAAFEPGAVIGRPREEGNVLLERARLEAERGGFREAIRLCHRAALVGLDRRGLVRFQESQTSGEVRSQLHAQVSDRPLFDALLGIYEPACFGKASVHQAEYAESRDLALRLLTGIPR